MKRHAKKKSARAPMDLVVYKTSEEADAAEREYWLSRTPRQRMQALEQLRQMNFNYGPGKPRPKFQRVLRVLELGED